MAATNPNASQGLAGQAAIDASIPLSDLVRGMQGSQGAQPGLRQTAKDNALGIEPKTEAPAAPQGRDFTGLGELLTCADQVAFKSTHDLVTRQELLSRNRLAQDRHWKNIKLGYTWSALEKVQDQDIYRQAFPPGSENLRPSAVPNKAADLCNKLVEILDTDPPLPSPQATDDSEAAERATELAAQFLKQDGGEQGTDDDTVFWAQTDLATTSASAYLHLWTDKQGGGWVPTQLKAHPQAQDANNPLVGPNGEPTTDYILRYVSAPDESGAIQFTTDPSQAGRTWLPKIRVEKWGREHLRLYPEDKDLNQCEAAIGLFYCTLGEAKRRWPDTVGQMDEQTLAACCDWTPNRYIVLLPPALRSRWKLTTGSATDPKGSSDDQRMMFYYAHYRVPTPDYPEGMVLMVNGADGGTMLDRDTLSAQVQMPSEGQQDQQVTTTRLMEIPIAAIRLLQDADEKDPTGTAFMRRIGSGSEAQATLATSYLEAMDKILHPARFATATSPIEAWQVEESRGSGDFVPVMSSADFPHYEEPPPIPGSFFQMVEWQTEQLNSIAGLPKPLQGADGQQEVSGVARRIAVGQAQISLSRMQQAWIAARKRYWRLKLQLATKYFTVPQLLKFVGEDGAYKQEWFTGVDFASVTSVDMQAGTGTMMPPQEKVQYVSQMAQMNFMTPDEAGEAARPTFSKTLGIPADPQLQRVERQASSWLEGPPEGWAQHAQAYDAELQQLMAQQPPPQPGQPPAPAPKPKTPAPWTPFAPMAPDDEPPIAAIRLRRLRRLVATVRFTSQPVRWQKVALDEYSRMRKAVADSAGSAAKAEQQTLIAVEQAKAQGAMQVAQAEAQAATQQKQQELQSTAQAKQQEIQLAAQTEQARIQAEVQLEQQKLQMQVQADQQKAEVAAQAASEQLQAESATLEQVHAFELEKQAREQAFALKKLELEMANALDIETLKINAAAAQGAEDRLNQAVIAEQAAVAQIERKN